MAASRWVDSGMAVFASGERTAERIAQAGYALHEHGVVLAELQARAARVDQDAQAFGMVVPEDGWLDPVHVPAQLTEQDLVHPSVVLRAQVRDRLVTAATALRLDEQRAHDQLARALRDLDAERVPMPGRQLSLPPAGPVGVGLAPSIASSVADYAARRGAQAAQGSAAVATVMAALEWPLRVLRHTPGSNVASFGTGVSTDVGTGLSTDDAVERNTVSTAAGMAATAVAATAVAAAAVPTAAAVGVPLAVGTVAGHAGAKAWDVLEERSKRPEPDRPGPRPLPRRMTPPVTAGRPPAIGTATTATITPRRCEDQDVATERARKGLREPVQY